MDDDDTRPVFLCVNKHCGSKNRWTPTPTKFSNDFDKHWPASIIICTWDLQSLSGGYICRSRILTKQATSLGLFRSNRLRRVSKKPRQYQSRCIARRPARSVSHWHFAVTNKKLSCRRGTARCRCVCRSWHLDNCHATVQKRLVRQVLNQVSAVANWPVLQNRVVDSAWRSVR